MKKTTQKELKRLIKGGHVLDVNVLSDKQVESLCHYGDLQTLAVSSGVYGVNGALVTDLETGQVYAIVGRTSRLLQVL